MALTAGGSQRWLFGPAADLLLGCGGLYACLALGFAAFGGELRARQADFLFPLLFLALGAPHYGATLLRVYQQREERRRYAVFAVWVTLAIAAAFLAGLVSPEVSSWLLTIYLTWSPWHYTGQNYGLAVMFMRRRGIACGVGTKRALHASFVLSYALVFLLFHGPIDSAPKPEFYSGASGAFRSLEIPPAVHGVLFPLFAVAYLATTGVALVSLRRIATWRDLGPTLLLVLSQSLWFSLPVAVRYWRIAVGLEPFAWQLRPYYFFWIALAHGVQYLWVTTYYARASRGWHGYLPYLTLALVAGTAVWTLPIAVVDLGLGAGALPNAAGVGLLVASCVNIHHFVLDGAIWKLRHMAIARVLIRDAPAEAALATGRRPDRGLVRGAVWALAAAGFGIGVFKYVHRDLLYPAALRRHDYAAARAIVERFSWVGSVSEEAREHLAASEQLHARARRQSELRLERRMGLLPNVAVYRRSAIEHEKRADWAAAIRQYELALRLDPENPALLRGAGLAWLERGDPARARDYLARAVELEPWNEGPRRELRRAELLLVARPTP